MGVCTRGSSKRERNREQAGWFLVIMLSIRESLKKTRWMGKGRTSEVTGRFIEETGGIT